MYKTLLIATLSLTALPAFAIDIAPEYDANEAFSAAEVAMIQNGFANDFRATGAQQFAKVSADPETAPVGYFEAVKAAFGAGS